MSGIYDWTTGEELGADDCPPEGAGLTAWIVCPAVDPDSLTLVDLRSVPSDVLVDIWSEATTAGDHELADNLRQLLP